MDTDKGVKSEVLEQMQDSAAGTGELLSMRGDKDLDSLLEIARKRVEFFDKVTKLSLLRTSVHDWTDQQGKPYLQSSGAEKLMAVWGIYVKETHLDIEMDELSGLPSYKMTGRVGSRLLGIEMDVIGGRNAADDFFAGTACVCGNMRRDHGDEQMFECPGFKLEPKRVDLLDVQKAAYSNFLVNAITRIIGMRGLTWDDVANVTEGRITKDTCTGKVTYKGKGTTANGNSAPTTGQPSEFVSYGQRNRFWAISMRAGWKKQEVKDFLAKQEPPIDSTDNIPKAKYDALCKALEEGASH